MERKTERTGTDGAKNTRSNTTATSDYPVSIKTIENFLRYVRNETDVIAVKIANDSLDHGKTVEQLLVSEQGLHLSVNPNSDGSYCFYVRCISGCVGRDDDVIGDGASWQVSLDPDGNVIRAFQNHRIFFD